MLLKGRKEVGKRSSERKGERATRRGEERKRDEPCGRACCPSPSLGKRKRIIRRNSSVRRSDGKSSKAKGTKLTLTTLRQMLLLLTTPTADLLTGLAVEQLLVRVLDTDGEVAEGTGFETFETGVLDVLLLDQALEAEEGRTNEESVSSTQKKGRESKERTGTSSWQEEYERVLIRGRELCSRRRPCRGCPVSFRFVQSQLWSRLPTNSRAEDRLTVF